MSDIEAYGSADLKLMWRVLARWMSLQPGELDGSYLARHIRDGFRPISESALTNQLPRAGAPLELRKWGWLIGNELERQKGVTPVATLRLGDLREGFVSEAAFRVAFISERSDGTLHAEGWRFEQAEPILAGDDGDDAPTPPAHPYAHAQAIIGWKRDHACLLHPPHTEGEVCDGIDPGTDESIDSERRLAAGATHALHPAFPLAVTSLAGLALSVVATLYGSRGSRLIVQGDRMLETAASCVGEDFQRLGAFN